MKATQDLIRDTDTKKTLILECGCGTHLLKVESYIDEFEQEYYFAMFHYGSQSEKHSLRERIKNAWKYLKTGKMFSDQIVLSVEQIQKLQVFIIETKKEEE